MKTGSKLKKNLASDQVVTCTTWRLNCTLYRNARHYTLQKCGKENIRNFTFSWGWRKIYAWAHPSCPRLREGSGTFRDLFLQPTEFTKIKLRTIFTKIKLLTILYLTVYSCNPRVHFIVICTLEQIITTIC